MPACASHGVHYCGLCIGADVGFHTEAPLLALLSQMHVGAALFVLVEVAAAIRLVVHDRAGHEQQAVLDQQLVDNGEQDLLCQLVFLQSAAKAQEGAFTWHPSIHIELGKLTIQGHTKKASSMAGSYKLNHCCRKCTRNVGTQRKWRPPVPAFRLVFRNKCNKCGPGNNALHIGQKLAFASFLALQIKVLKRACLMLLIYSDTRFPTAKLLEFCRASLKK